MSKRDEEDEPGAKKVMLQYAGVEIDVEELLMRLAKAEEKSKKDEERIQRADERAEKERKEKDDLLKQISMQRDLRVRRFDNVSQGGSSKIPVKTREEVDNNYNSCLFCGEISNRLNLPEHAWPRKWNLSRAHLLANDKKSNSVFTDRYKTAFDPECARNLIVLCGSHGQGGTCHDEFDNERILFYYDCLRGKYMLYMFESEMDDGFRTNKLPLVQARNATGALDSSVPKSEDVRPYSRLLRWRAKHSLERYRYLASAETIEAIDTLNDLSEKSDSVIDEDDDEGDEGDDDDD